MRGSSKVCYHYNLSINCKSGNKFRKNIEKRRFKLDADESQI
jgi:hypothetical protein